MSPLRSRLSRGVIKEISELFTAVEQSGPFRFEPLLG
jgi:hypothetical protein